MHTHLLVAQIRSSISTMAILKGRLLMNSTIISIGNSFRIFDSAVQTHDELPVDVYKVAFSELGGYTLERAALEVGDEKVYGNHDTRLARIRNAYNNSQRSLGVLMSGDKGMGKSLMVRMIAQEFQENQKLPVVLVDENTPGIAAFLDTLGECVVIFDEFEKKFPLRRREDTTSPQEQFLSLFDGMSSQRRVYVVTVNSLDNLSNFFVNRPGRFHYHIRFDYPEAEQVAEYLTDQVQDITQKEVDNVVAFSRKTKINYDHLRAIAFELNIGGTFAEIIGDLNIKNVDDMYYEVTVKMSDGSVWRNREPLDLFSGEDEETYVRKTSGKRENYFSFSFTTDGLVYEQNGITVPLESLYSANFNCDTELQPVEVRLSLIRQDLHAF